MRKLAVIIWLLLCSPLWATDRYVDSTTIGGAVDGTSWVNAYGSVAAALGVSAAGDRIFVSHLHAFAPGSGTAITWTSPGTAASPVQIICVTEAGPPPTAKVSVPTGSESTSGAAHITITGHLYVYGMILNSGTSTNAGDIRVGYSAGAPGSATFDTCKLVINNTNTTSAFQFGGFSSPDNYIIQLVNTSLTRSSAVQGFRIYCRLIWRDTPTNAFQGTAPNDGINPSFSSGTPADVELRGLDLSLCTAALIDINSETSSSIVRMFGCKLGAGVTPLSGTLQGPGACELIMVNCSDGDTNINYHKQNYQGTITEESTIVKSTGGSDGTTPISYKMVTSANAKVYMPLTSEPIIVWNDTTGSSVSVVVDTITDNVTLEDDEAWIDVYYAGTSNVPLYLVTSDRIVDHTFGTAANQATDSDSTWTTTGLATPVEQELSTSFTALEKGFYLVYVNLANDPAAATTPITMYFDPKVKTGSRQFAFPYAYVNEGSSVSGVSRARAQN